MTIDNSTPPPAVPVAPLWYKLLSKKDRAAFHAYFKHSRQVQYELRTGRWKPSAKMVLRFNKYLRNELDKSITLHDMAPEYWGRNDRGPAKRSTKK